METVTTILCAVDFSKGSDRAVNQAAVLANATGAAIELLHVYQLPVLALPDGVVTATPDFVARLTTQAQEALDRHREQLATQGVRATTRLLEGNAIETIVKHAKEIGASMLVLGTHGRSGFKHLMLGSTAERVVRSATVPVLTVSSRRLVPAASGPNQRKQPWKQAQKPASNVSSRPWRPFATS